MKTEVHHRDYIIQSHGKTAKSNKNRLAQDKAIKGCSPTLLAIINYDQADTSEKVEMLLQIHNPF